MVNEVKRQFLQTQFLPLIQQIDPGAIHRWGKMNAQQMVEHVSDFFRISSGRLIYPLVTPLEHLPKYRDFLLSEKDFRENTKAPVLPDEPLALRHAAMNESIVELEEQVDNFFLYFSHHPGQKTLHPAFGELNFEEWVQLHHKHVKHHLKQFGKNI